MVYNFNLTGTFISDTTWDGHCTFSYIRSVNMKPEFAYRWP